MSSSANESRTKILNDVDIKIINFLYNVNIHNTRNEEHLIKLMIMFELVAGNKLITHDEYQNIKQHYLTDSHLMFIHEYIYPFYKNFNYSQLRKLLDYLNHSESINIKNFINSRQK